MCADVDPRDNVRCSPTRFDALPAEILALIANGADAAGNPILDPRYRFHLAQVSRALRACVSSPVKADAARLARHPGATQAWIEGRAASIALAVQQHENRSRDATATPTDGSLCGAPTMIPADPHRGEVASTLATAPAQQVVRAFIDMVERLAPTATDWFPRVDAVFCRGHHVDDGPETLSLRALTCRNVLVLACRLGRTDVVDDLLRWYDLHHPATIRACLRAAVTMDNGALATALICRAARRGGGHPARAEHCRGVQALFKDTLEMAASAGKINVMRWLMAGAPVGGATRIDPFVAVWHTPSILEHDCHAPGCAFAATDSMHMFVPWVLCAAAHNRVDVFAQAAAEGWVYTPAYALACAVAHGSLDVADFMASSAGSVVEPRHGWVLEIGDVIAFNPLFATDGVRLARGLEWLRSHGAVLSLHDTVDMAEQFHTRPDLVACLLAVDTPLPDAMARPFVDGDRMAEMVRRGQWSVLRRVIVAYGRAADEARSIGKRPAAPGWWRMGAERVDIVHTPRANCLGNARGRSIGALTALHHMARMCALIIESAPDDDDDDIGAACWRRWCSPEPLTARKSDRDDVDATMNAEHKEKTRRMLVDLSAAGLVLTDDTRPSI
nr:hypothetical protein [Pandoravirus belohorizontensis]